MNSSSSPLFVTRLSIALLCCSLLLALACSKQSSTAVNCGEGTLYRFNSQTYCTYSAALIGSAFTCPLAVPHRTTVGDTVVCSAEETLPSDFSLPTENDTDTSSVTDTDTSSVTDTQDSASDAQSSADTSPDTADTEPEPTVPEGSIELSVTIENKTKESVFLHGLKLPYTLRRNNKVRELFPKCPCSVCGSGKPACTEPLSAKVAVELPAGKTVTITASIIEYLTLSEPAPNCPEGLGGSGNTPNVLVKDGFCNPTRPLDTGFEVYVEYDRIEWVQAQCVKNSEQSKWELSLWTETIATPAKVNLRWNVGTKFTAVPNTSAQIKLSIDDLPNPDKPHQFPPCPE